ncbi:helix-turn-helix domain-containing protein [Leptospira perolatii]|uniref:helix-turn-helix domain-containing protein n=1 Tax=Leptospira perolatii TaxID=2023191 RepID=UPI0013FE4902|nr:helix-turn-helix domain-containing protein [Leptospira perolatii]
MFLGLADSGLILYLPHLLWVNAPSLFLLGPAFYLYSRVISTGPDLSKKDFLHLIPAVLCIAAFMPIYLLSTEEKIRIMLNWNWENADFGIHFHIVRAGILSVCAYYFFSLRRLYQGGLDNRRQFILLLTGIPTVVLLSFGLWFGKLWIQHIGGILLEIHLITFYLLMQRDSKWQVWLKLPARPDREESRLNNLDIPQILLRLESLMTQDRCFADEDLSLNRLADLMDLQRHQLSELLNRVIGTDFKSYINKFRIEEAKVLLLSEPDRSILSIAFAVGFNSKSAFNLVFRKVTGITPTAYREMGESKIVV